MLIGFGLIGYVFGVYLLGCFGFSVCLVCGFAVPCVVACCNWFVCT